MKRKSLPNNAIKILADLARARRPLSVKRIAERNKIAWKTANTNIKKLERRGAVKCERSTRRTYCKVTRQVKRDLGI